MPIRLVPHPAPPGQLDLSNLTPDRLSGESVAAIERIRVRVGGREVAAGELFSITGRGAEELVFAGDLPHAYAIGRGMQGGHLRVEGSVGPHAGAEMTGGRLQIEGNAGAYLGAEMKGGQIDVGGDAGDWVGGAWPGSRRGMNRGAIFVRGSAGAHAGFRMRRGTVVIAGACGPHPGWQMRAGTLVALGPVSGSPGTIGFDLIRGSIVVTAPLDTTRLMSRGPAWTGNPVWFPLLASELAEVGVGAPERESLRGRFGLYPLNPLTRLRGELWIRLAD